MPYRNIRWIKLEKRLLNDWRFYTMDEFSQLVYVKLLLISAETNNKIPKNLSILKTMLRTDRNVSEIKKSIKKIKEHFCKFTETKNYYKFKGFTARHNRVRPKSSQSSAKGKAQAGVDKKRIDKIRKEYINIKGWSINHLNSNDFARTGKAIKMLCKRTDNDKKIIKAMHWINKQGYEWTLETLNKKWLNYINRKPEVRYE